MGPNGSGKSTLSNILSGKKGYEVNGTVTFEGEDLLALETEERAHKGIFLAFQYPLEIPGVNTNTFLKTSINAIKKARGEKELDAIEFLKLIKQKSLELKFRQFWSSALYKENFFKLKDDGNRSVSEKGISDYDPNTNFNLWNLDLSYDWEFSPGSKLTLLYRNNIFNEDNLSGISYYRSTKELFENPINHQFSLRVNYFIDYNLLKKKKI